jgi:hypothetical protein
MDADKLPPVSLALVEALEKIYPSRPPSITDSDRMVWFKAGQASVVEFLRKVYQEQNETHVHDQS